MANPIPLEDNFNDVIGKAQRGLKIPDDALASQAGISVDELTKIKGGEFVEAAVRKVASPLKLQADSLVELGLKAWFPESPKLDGLEQFNTPFEDMTVNSFLVYDILTKVGIAFDTGASATSMLAFARQRMIRIKLILITHIHGDHIADLAKLKKDSGAQAWVCDAEPVDGAEPFKVGKEFSVGNFDIQTRQTSGHAKGGITYVVRGLKKPVAVVGDAIFCSSMGGGMVSYDEALKTNRENIFSLPDETILCPGHGPLTTVGEQKQHNPFYPEFRK